MLIEALAAFVLAAPANPAATITKAPRNATRDATPSFDFSASPPESLLECSMDGSPFESCKSSFRPAKPLVDGAHVFRVRPVGTKVVSAVHRFVLDTVAPQIQLISPVDGSSTAAETIDVELDLNEAVTVTTSAIAQSGMKLPAGRSILRGIGLRKDGYNTFSTFVQDDAGNSTLLSFHLFRDNTAPTLQLLVPRDGAKVSSPEVHALFSLNEDAEVVATSTGFLPLGRRRGGQFSFQLTLKDGPNDFTVKLRDSAGNESESLAFHLTRDVSRPAPPQIEIPNANTTISSRTVRVQGSTDRRTASVRLDGSSRVLAPAEGGRFSADVPLSVGLNVVRVASIGENDVESSEIALSVTSDARFRVSIDGGDLQVVAPGKPAGAPLVVRVTDESGKKPIQGVDVTFRVLHGPGKGASFGTGGTAATSRTNGAGRASVRIVGSDAEGDRGGLEPVLVEATIDAQVGPAARFRVQSLLAARFSEVGTGVPRYLFPLATNCTSTSQMAGDCPVGIVGTTLQDSFAVVLLDEGFRAVPGWSVTFEALDQGSFSKGTNVSVQTDAFGVARSKAFRLAEKINDPVYLLLHPSDAFATGTALHRVRAKAAPDVGRGVTRLQADLAAYAFPGPTTRLEDLSGSAPVGGHVELAAQEPLAVRASDAHGNPVSNAAVTFTALGDEPRVFRSNVTASSAPRCRYRMPHRDDPCARATLSVLTGPDGIGWAQLLLGEKSGTEYQTKASSGTAAVTLSRRTIEMNTAEVVGVLQIAANDASVFAITGTENNDEDHVSAVTWEIRCEGPLCHSRRRIGDTIVFQIDGGASFRPAEAVTGSTPILPWIQRPELGALVTGGNKPGGLNPRFEARWGTGALWVPTEPEKEPAQ